MNVKKRAALAAPFGVLTIVVVAAAAAYACTNYVGYMQLTGSGSGTNTVTVTGLDTWNGPQWMQQTVSSAVVSAPTSGTFKVYTGGINTTDKYLRAGTYDVNVQNGNSSSTYGYTNHTTWNNPGGDCMTWTLDSNTKKVGTVTYNAGNTTGQINSAATWPAGTPVTVSSGWAGPFALPALMNTSPGSYEQAVCISSSDSVNGNQAPLDVT